MINSKLPFPWFSAANFEAKLEQSDLSLEEKELVKYFADYGYVIINPKIDNFDDLAAQIKTELAPVYLDENRPNWHSSQGRLQDSWYFNKSQAVQSIAAADDILRILQLLYQREPIPFQTLNFAVGTQQKTHSDTVHFHSIPAGFMCGVWIAFEDIDEFNGPLHYYPRSHKLPILSQADIGTKNYPEYEIFVENLMIDMGLEKVSISIKKGQALVWDANLFHGGDKILDKTRTRHTQVTHYFFTDCLYYNPHVSDPLSQTIGLREVINIATHQSIPHYYKGRYRNHRHFSHRDNISTFPEEYPTANINDFPLDFDEDIYLALNPDVAASGIDPKQHYLNFGIYEERAYQYPDSSLPLDFDEDIYCQLHPDVVASGISAKKHFLEFGIKEGRQYKL